MNIESQADAAVIDRQPRRDIVPFDVDGVKFVLDISELSPQAQRPYKVLSEHKSLYEPVMTRCLTKLITQMKEPRFMDIGSFAGYYTCYIATLLGNGSRPVVALESNAGYCEGLRRACEVNGLRNVKVYEAILSDRAEPAHVDRAMVITGGTAGENMKTTVTLDQLCERESITPPNIIKMDIHGSEGKALPGMTAVLRQVDYLLLELHGQDRLDEYSGGVKRSAIMTLLWDLGLSVYYVAGHTLNPKQWNRDCIRSGRFAYRKLTTANADCLLFDRLWHVFLLVTPRDDVRAVLDDSLTDPFFCY